MTDLIANLNALRMTQKNTAELLPPQEIEPWIKQGEKRIQELKQQHPDPDSREYEEGDCITGLLDEIQENRAAIIWANAFDQSGDVSRMTGHEAGIYRDLIEKACELKGEA